MARRQIFVMTDDIDGGDASETMNYAVDGVLYEIDLSARNAQKFREALMPWMGASRRIGRVGSTTAVARGAARATAANTHVPTAAERNASDNTAIREWAKRAGKQINDRGRIPERLVAQYREAQAREAIGPIRRPDPQLPTTPPVPHEAVEVEVDQPDLFTDSADRVEEPSESPDAVSSEPAEEPAEDAHTAPNGNGRTVVTSGAPSAFLSPFSA